MRRALIGLAFVGMLSAVGSSAQAQVSAGFSDPFFLYYGFYLPRQASLAAQPTTQTMLSDVTQSRQNFTLADRAGLYDPVQSPFNVDQIDPSSPFARRGAERLPHLPPPSVVRPRAHNGMAPGPYYNRTARYFPSTPSGSGPNRNVAQSRASRGGGGGMAGGMMGSAMSTGMGAMPGMGSPGGAY